MVIVKDTVTVMVIIIVDMIMDMILIAVMDYSNESN